MEVSTDWIPRIGMEFDSVEEAWNFWVQYGGKMGFNIRRHYENRSKKNGEVTSRRFVCSKEGFRPKDKREHLVTSGRAETRTGCKVRMGFSSIKSIGRYQIHDFISNHNHILHLPETSHLLSSQRKITEAQAIEIELADESGIRPRVAHEFIGAHVGGSSNFDYTYRDHKNYLHSKRQRDLKYGEAGSLLKYFHLQTVENPSFQYSIQLDSEEKMTNIVWADAKMLIDYAVFGDAVPFDITFGTNKEHRPLGVFVGFNHFREVVVFGVALLYDETTESFKWLFETFLATHDNKEPKTIFTDQDIAMGKAIAEVMPNTWHGLCTWHIMQNATKHLMHDGSNILEDFRACMYDYEEEAKFEETFSAIRGKSSKSTWLDSIYALKEKWAECYMTNVFSLGMRSTQLSESLNKDLKEYLKSNMDIMWLFKHFDRVVRQKRQNEINSEFDAREKLPKIKMRRTPLLRQAGQLYTPQVFEAFQDEYEWSTAAYIKPRVEGQLGNEYRIGISDPEGGSTDDVECQVFGDPLSEIVSCSCKMFERLGILCAHALKVLDTMNIKLIPQKYILKHWTREARVGSVQDIFRRTIVEDPQLDATRRFRALCRKFVKVASRAANFAESSSLLEGGLDNVILEVEKLLSTMEPQSAEVVPQQVSEDAYIKNKATLKKKEGRKGGKRKIHWNEKIHKGNMKNNSKKKKQNSQDIENQPTQLNHGGNPLPTVEQSTKIGSNCGNSQAYNIGYTQLLLGEYNINEEFFLSQDMNMQFGVDSQAILSNVTNANWLEFRG